MVDTPESPGTGARIVRKSTSEVLVQPIGGLGNQFFSFFAGYLAAQSRNSTLVVDLSRRDTGVTAHGVSINNYSVMSWPNVAEDRAPRKFLRLISILSRLATKVMTTQKAITFFRAYTSASPERDWEVLKSSTPRSIALKGHFINQKLLDHVVVVSKSRQIILNKQSRMFSIAQREIRELDPICVHIRRGDYLRSGSQQSALGLEYYFQALNQLGKPDRPIWIFTDSPNDGDVLAIASKRTSLIVANTFSLSAEEEFALLLEASSVIGANSTFSLMAMAIGRAKTGTLPSSWGPQTPGFRLSGKARINYLEAIY
jgi:hypothetical protein